MHVGSSLIAGNVSHVVTHGFAQCHAPGAPPQAPDARKSGEGARFACGLAPGRMPAAPARGDPNPKSNGAARAATPRLIAACRALSWRHGGGMLATRGTVG